MKAKDFDRLFDSGGDVFPYLDLKRARRPDQKVKRVTVGFPTWVIAALDKEAAKLGVSRQDVIRQWIATRVVKRMRPRSRS